MAAERRREVLQTSLRTSRAALLDPEPISALPVALRFDEAG